MIAPFKNDTNLIVKKMVIRNLQSDKKKNFFCVVTIIIAVALVVIASLTVQNIIQKNNEEVGKLHQGIVYNINSNVKEMLQSQKGIKRVGLCTEVMTLKYDAKKLTLLYYDESMRPSMGEEFTGSLPKDMYDIVVSESMLAAQEIPIELGQCIPLEIKGVKHSFKVSGILGKTGQATTNYVALISQELSAEILGNKQYNAYIWLDNSQDLSKEAAVELLKGICDKLDLQQWSVSSYYDYIEQSVPIVNYVGYFFGGLFLLVAAGLVIYSVFYISIGNKMTQYAQLRTIGAGKKQIYQMVLREGTYLSVTGEFVGIILGILVSYLINQSGWTIKAIIITVITAIFFGTILTHLCVRKPAELASCVSPIAAIRNLNYSVSHRFKNKKKTITPTYIAYLNIMRNKKKALFTVLSMSICGILFMLAATYYSSFSAESMARIWDMQYGDYTLSINLEGNDDSLNELLKSNYFSNELLTSINQIEGVKGIKHHLALPVDFEVENENVNDNTLIMGYDKNDIPKLDKALIEGGINAESDDQIIVSDPDRIYDVYHWKPKIGQKIKVSFFNEKDETIKQEFTIAGLTSAKDGMQGYIFRMPQNVLNKMSGFDCTYGIEIKTVGKENSVESHLRDISDSNSKIELKTFEEKVLEHKADNALGFALAFSLVLICGTFAILSQINLSITNLLNRSKEIGILQSIGMTRKQLVTSFIMEGIFMSMVSVAIMFVSGIPGGYVIGNMLKTAGMSEGYSMPILLVGIFIILVIILQIILSVIMISQIKKQSIIEQLRNIES